MNDSILNSIKKLLGIAEEYESFDTDIIMHINTVFTILYELGIGPAKGFSIKDDSSTWADFLSNEIRYDSVKTYIYLRVKMLFDPPLSSAVIEAQKQIISELENRLIIMSDEIADEEEVNQNG